MCQVRVYAPPPPCSGLVSSCQGPDESRAGERENRDVETSGCSELTTEADHLFPGCFPLHWKPVWSSNPTTSSALRISGGTKQGWGPLRVFPDSSKADLQRGYQLNRVSVSFAVIPERNPLSLSNHPFLSSLVKARPNPPSARKASLQWGAVELTRCSICSPGNLTVLHLVCFYLRIRQELYPDSGDP